MKNMLQDINTEILNMKAKGETSEIILRKIQEQIKSCREEGADLNLVSSRKLGSIQPIITEENHPVTRKKAENEKIFLETGFEVDDNENGKDANIDNISLDPEAVKEIAEDQEDKDNRNKENYAKEKVQKKGLLGLIKRFLPFLAPLIDRFFGNSEEIHTISSSNSTS